MSTETHPFIDHLVINHLFLKDYALEKEVQLLEVQDWSKLYLEKCSLNRELARQFFSMLILTSEGSSTVGTFIVNGKDYALTVRELSKILGVPAAGYNDYIKNAWPSYLPKEVMLNRVLGPASSSQGHTMSQEGMDFNNKVCYMLLRANIVPRKEGCEKVGILDAILINKILGVRRFAIC